MTELRAPERRPLWVAASSACVRLLVEAVSRVELKYRCPPATFLSSLRVSPAAVSPALARPRRT